jgi:hypothetical protein
MAVYEKTFSGGLGSSVTVTEEPTLIEAENDLRGWLYMRSVKANTADVFLHFTEDAANVAADAGVPLYPGEFFEVNNEDKYLGNVWMICKSGETAVISTHSGIV